MLFGLVLLAEAQSTNIAPYNGDYVQPWWVGLLTAIVFPTLLWLFSPQDVKHTVIDFFTRNRIKSDNLVEDIKALDLGISNERLLSVKKFVHNYRYVFFPVVPNKTPNIIHITFINAIKGLEQLGFHVYVFIFDQYYCRVQGYEGRSGKTYISNFAKCLQDMGINSNQILFESRVIKRRGKSKRMLANLYNITSQINISQANNLSVVNSHYLSDDSKYIRRFKSILNMTYSSCISSKIGFVLSGKDEQKLWEIYANEINNNIVHLYIEPLYISESILSDVLNPSNLSYEDSLDVIKEKVRAFFQDPNMHNDNCGIFYLLKHNYFIKKKAIEFSQDNGIFSISTIDAFMSYSKTLFEQGKMEDLVDVVANTVFNIFHPQKGETL